MPNTNATVKLGVRCVFQEHLLFLVFLVNLVHLKPIYLVLLVPRVLPCVQLVQGYLYTLS